MGEHAPHHFGHATRANHLLLSDSEFQDEQEQQETQARTTRYGRTIRQPTMLEPKMRGRYHEVVRVLFEQYGSSSSQLDSSDTRKVPHEHRQ